MAIYSPPVLHLNELNSSVINVSDMESSSLTSNITMSQGDARYLRQTGGTVYGNVKFSGTSNTFSNSISVPSISLSSNTNSQSSNQIGFFESNTGAFGSGSLATYNNSGTIIQYTGLTLASGVYSLTYSHVLSCTTSFTLNYVIHGVINGSVGTFNNLSANSSYFSETIPSSSTKYITGTYIVRPSSTTNYYGGLQLSYTTGGSMTDNMAISATRIA